MNLTTCAYFGKVFDVRYFNDEIVIKYLSFIRTINFSRIIHPLYYVPAAFCVLGRLAIQISKTPVEIIPCFDLDADICGD